MAITPLGKYLRNLRCERGDVLFCMAKRLGISSADLSGIEIGRKPMPLEIQARIVADYGLGELEA